jgi:outer membrane lipoprotein-sorting protein
MQINFGGRNMKKISIIALLLVLVMSLTACASDEQKLFSAFNKMQDITSMDSTMEMSMILGAEGFPEEAQADLEQIMSLLNVSKLTMKQRTVQNKDKTAAKAKMDINLNVGGMLNEDLNIWVDTDMSGDSLKMLEIIKMPAMLMNFITPDPAKEYLVYDIGEMMNTADEDINFSELMEWSKELQPKMAEYLKNLEGKFNPGFEIVKEKEKRVVDGKTLTMYEVKIDDAALKELIIYTGNYFMDDEDTIEFIKEYMDMVMKMVNIPEEEKEAAIEEMNLALQEIEKEMPNIKEKFNTFMDTYKDVKILGDKGIVIEFGINGKGFITHEAGTIDLRIDLEEIGKLVGEEIKGVLSLEISYNSKIYNINNKVIRVELPKVDENNSLNLMEMLEAQMTNMNDFLPVEPTPEQTIEVPQLP